MRPPESFIGQPVRSLQTMLRVIAEDDGRMPRVVPDGVYGPATMTAVSAFQRRYGLPVTGVTNQQTWDKIVEIFQPARIRITSAAPVAVVLNPGQVFCRGDCSPYLYLAQSMLTVLAQLYGNLSPAPCCGTLESDTAAALACFQPLCGLPATGELDRMTWQYLSQHFTLAANRLAGTKRSAAEEI